MPLDQIRAAAASVPGSTLQVARPRLPPARALAPYLRQIDANAWYSNHGPLAGQFQARLAAHWGLATGSVALVSSATSGLTLLLQASGARPGSRCLMPSWTFVATACAVVAAGLIPHFVDVRQDDWAPDPAEVLALCGKHDVGAILVVSPFGAPLDLAAWDAVQATTGLPVVIDAAAAFDALRAGGPMPPGRCPAVVSLHATKTLGVGEGGAVLCSDPAVMHRVRRLAQFGFLGSREALLPGVNAKLSEYAAAVGLAGLDGWRETRDRWMHATGAYAALLPPEVIPSPGFGSSWVSSTLTVTGTLDGAQLERMLAGHGIATVRWWGPGCHAHAAFHQYPSEALPVTQGCASRAVGLPFWQDLTRAQIERVCRALRHCLPASPAPARATRRSLVPA